MSEKTPLFNEYEAMNEDGRNLSQTIADFAARMAAEAIKRNESLIEMESIFHSSVAWVFAEYRLKQAMLRKRESEAKG